tara:strand:+ start:446 stop:757 length:312 start_codon:yes stop_codon:yes gene_type:complete
MNTYEKIYNMLTEAEGDKPGTEDPFSDLWNQQATAGRRLLPRRPKRAPQTTAGATRSPSGQKASKKTSGAARRGKIKKAKDTARKLTSLMAARRARRQARVSQ